MRRISLATSELGGSGGPEGSRAVPVVQGRSGGVLRLGTAGRDEGPESVVTSGRGERREGLVPVLEGAVLAAPGEDRARQGVQLVLEGRADGPERLVRPADDDRGG